jgi:dethiobiotin synthetase/adenosylmethionine--8-amino-7-oxononanoate aminotransferase
LSDKKIVALLHGHSYTANPIGCSVALKAIEITEKHRAIGGWDTQRAMWGVQGPSEEGRWSFWNPDFVSRISQLHGVKGTMAMGTVLAIELEDNEAGYSSHTALDFLTSLRKEVISDGHGPASSSKQSEEEAFGEFKIHSRPLGNVVYIMTSLFTKDEVMRGMERILEKRLKELGNKGGS